MAHFFRNKSQKCRRYNKPRSAGYFVTTMLIIPGWLFMLIILISPRYHVEGSVCIGILFYWQGKHRRVERHVTWRHWKVTFPESLAPESELLITAVSKAWKSKLMSYVHGYYLLQFLAYVLSKVWLDNENTKIQNKCTNIIHLLFFLHSLT